MPHLLNWTELFKDLVGMFAILNPLGAIPNLPDYDCP